MYDLVMEQKEVGVLPSRLQKAIELRRTSPAQLARDSGVSKATISQILAGDRPNTPASIVAKLARALLVSVDYLVGITDDPEPKALGLGEDVIELAQIAKQLSILRQRDLVNIAKTYVDTAEETKHLVLNEMKDMIFAAADEAGRGEELDDFLDQLMNDARNGNDSSEPPVDDGGDDDGGEDEPPEN